MVEGPGDIATQTARATSDEQSRWSAWAGYAACAWAFVFAAASFYWAAGGTVGIDTLSPEILSMARNPGFAALVWGTGVAKVILGLLALALVRPWGRLVPRRVLLTAAWGAGTLMVLYEGAANLVVRALMAVGLISTPESMHSAAARWHLVLWDPWWLLGGILFCAAAWHYQRAGAGRPNSEPR